MALDERIKVNFETLCRAFRNRDAGIMECKRVSDGRIVALLVAVQTLADGTVSYVPFAEMIDGNPYEQYCPPLAEGGFAPMAGVHAN